MAQVCGVSHALLKSDCHSNVSSPTEPLLNPLVILGMIKMETKMSNGSGRRLKIGGGENVKEMLEKR